METYFTETDRDDQNIATDQLLEDAINMPRSAFIAVHGMKNIELWRRFNDPDFIEL